MIKETFLEIIFDFLFLVANSNSNTLRSSSFSRVEIHNPIFVQPEAFQPYNFLLEKLL